MTGCCANKNSALGEAYQDGWWDADRVDDFLAKVLVADLQYEIKANIQLAAVVARSVFTNRQSKRSAGRNASAHYDIGNDLFERMLDKRMIYSCGYWRNADDLGAAHEAKLELICQKLQLTPGMRVLDIGCGWGGFAAYAATHHATTVTAISPAAAQIGIG